MKLYDLILLVPLFPLIGAAFNGLVSNRLGLEKKVTHTVALIGSGAAWLWGTSFAAPHVSSVPSTYPSRSR